MNRTIKSIGKKIIGPDNLKIYRSNGVKGLLNISEKKLKVAFIGCGTHAIQNIYPSLRYANVDLIATCANHEEKAKRTAKLFGADNYYTDYKKMFNDEKLDAVFVVVNEEKHAKICIDAMESGLPVFVEKPPGNTLKEVKEMVNISRRTKKPLMVGFQKRFAPTYNEMKRVISQNFNPTYIHSKFCVGKVDKDRDLLFNIGIHHLDILQYFMGDVKKIYVEKNITCGQTSYGITLKFKSDAIGQMVLSSQGLWNKENERIEILGKEEGIIVENIINLKYYRKSNSMPGIVPKEDEQTLVWQPNFTVPSDENQLFFLNGYVHEIRHFVDVILKKKKLESSIDNSVRTYELLEELYNV